MRIADRISPGRIARLRRLAEWHDEWEQAALAATDYGPERYPDSPDHNVHYVDVDAPADLEDEFHVQAREIMGLDPRT